MPVIGMTDPSSPELPEIVFLAETPDDVQTAIEAHLAPDVTWIPDYGDKETQEIWRLVQSAKPASFYENMLQVLDLKPTGSGMRYLGTFGFGVDPTGSLGFGTHQQSWVNPQSAVQNAIKAAQGFRMPHIRTYRLRLVTP